MRSRSFQFAALVVIVTLVSGLVLPVVALAQEGTGRAMTPCQQAKADAEAVSSTGYAVGGFFCGVFGWVFATMSKPRPPESILVGMPAEDADQYVQCYESAAKEKHQKAACVGWGIGAAVALAVNLALLSATD